MKKVFLFVSIGITLLAIPVTVFLTGKNQEVRKRAAPATTMSLSPAALTKKVGEKLQLDVRIDTGENQVGTAQIQITYDPTFLKATDITHGALAPRIILSGKVDESGVATITVGANSTTQPITGTGIIATLYMDVVESSADPISVGFAPSPDTYVNAIGEGQINVLTGTTGARIIILNADGTESARSQQTALDQSSKQATQSGVAPSQPPTPVRIQFSGNQGNTYDPDEVTIPAGQSVTWEGDFTTHPLVSVDNLWTPVNTETEFTHTFEATGTYVYFCETHGTATSGMRGVITVTDTSTSLSRTEDDTATGGGDASSSATLAITSPVENGQTASTRPVFTGTAPPGSTVTITIHSETQTAVVTADANGNWVYTAEEDLDPGPHTVDVLVVDAATGETHSDSVPFVVAGGRGGGEATDSGMPISGNTEITLVLLVFGSLLLLGGAIMPMLAR